MPEPTTPDRQRRRPVVYRTVLGAPADGGWWRIEIEGLPDEVWSIYQGFYWKPGEDSVRIGDWSPFDPDGDTPRFTDELPLTEPHLETAFRAIWEHLEPRLRAAQTQAGS